MPQDRPDDRPSRRAVLAGAAVMAGSGTASAYSPAEQVRPPRIERQGARLLLHHGNEVTQVRLPCAGVASVIRCPAADLSAAGGFFAAHQDHGAITEENGGPVLRGDGITVRVDAATGRLHFLDHQGRERLAEVPAPPVPGLQPSRSQGFTIPAGEALHGLGQYRDPVLDYRDTDLFLAHANSDAASPFLLSSGGWGLLWDTGTAAHVRSRGTSLAFHSVAGELVRYHVCVADDADGAIARYRSLTGEASLLPKWAYGYWQSKERYASQTELEAVVDGYRSRDLPLDAIVLDWRYWGESDQFSGMRFDPAAFPDPRGMVDHVHRRGVHLLTSIWPAFGPATAIYREMAAANLLFPGAHWSGGRVFDATSPAARDIYWRHIREGLMDIGVDGLWTDGNEPEFMATGDRYGTAGSFMRNRREAAGPIDENLLTFSFYQSRGIAEGMRRDVPAKRPVILSRSCYAGQQAHGVVTWSGDIFASWQTLRNQVVAAINFAASGLPYWTCDIGGFLVTHRFPDGLADPAWRELYVRWFQFGAFLPVFRAHGTQVPRELWQFGKPGEATFDALRKALELRYTLLPYIYSLADQVRGGAPMLRALPLAYPADPGCHGRADSYLFGRDLLVRVVDRPLLHAPSNPQEFIPNGCVTGIDAPAAQVEFFEGAGFERRVHVRDTDDLKMTWFGDLPEALKGKPYSARWTGRIVAPETGSYSLVLTGKGAIRLMLDGRVVVDGKGDAGQADGANGGVSFKGHEGDSRYRATVTLEKGRSYPFRLEQRQPVADAVSLWVEWVTPEQRRLATPDGSQSVDVYLPAGTDWYDWHDGRRIRGGQRLSVEAPLDRMPIFARAGAIIPTAPGRTRATEKIDRLIVRVFAGRDGSFVLYDDAGDGEGYRRGEATRTVLGWIDATRTFIIGPDSANRPEPAGPLLVEVIVTDGRKEKRGTVRYIGHETRLRIA